jgi:hypothetical protein
MFENRPPAFVASVIFGVVALVLILLGFVTGSHVVYGASIIFAALSLFAALVWRSQLVAAWRAEHRPPPPENPF